LFQRCFGTNRGENEIIKSQNAAGDLKTLRTKRIKNLATNNVENLKEKNQ